MSSNTNSSSTSRPDNRENISYALYLHRQELERPKRCRRLMRVASTKLQLTNELIWLHARRQWLEQDEEQKQLEEEAPSYQQQCNALNRERQYRDILERNMQQQLQKQQQKKRQHLEATLKRRH